MNVHPRHHGHDHAEGGHGHTHGIIDPSITTSGKGLWAIKWSFIGLTATAALQLVVVIVSGSVALLADTIHNFGDAANSPSRLRSRPKSRLWLRAHAQQLSSPAPSQPRAFR